MRIIKQCAWSPICYIASSPTYFLLTGHYWPSTIILTQLQDWGPRCTYSSLTAPGAGTHFLQRCPGQLILNLAVKVAIDHFLLKEIIFCVKKYLFLGKNICLLQKTFPVNLFLKGVYYCHSKTILVARNPLKQTETSCKLQKFY